MIYTASNRLYRITAQAGAAPDDLSAVLAGGAPSWGDTASDGEWLVYAGDTGCSDYSECLMIAHAGAWSSAVEVRPGGQSVHPAGRATIASGGDAIVYAAPGTHALDLFATTRTGAAWSAPIEITTGSNRDYNQLPRFSADAAKLTFDCGSDQYSQTGTTICEVGRDGSGFTTLLEPWLAAGSPNERHHAEIAPDGSVVFEADANGERIWRLALGSQIPALIGNFNNDNTPCVLPDGRVASIYLGGSGAHELKVMNADGTSPVMLVTYTGGEGLTDIGLGCGL
ncbi:MAG TPA: hypothetical protein VFQ65_02110 [Kofleriaceae bacterium]|nr:hypothetical protein [Kofleriaceae bacterium]